MKNLENLGVQELNSNEIQEIQGGFWNFIIGGAVGLIAMGIHDAVDYPDAFMRGLRGQASQASQAPQQAN